MNNRTAAEAYWHDVSKSGYPDNNGLYLAITRNDFPYGADVETLQFYKKGAVLFALSGEDLDMHVIKFCVKKDGFYQPVSDDWATELMEEVPVTFWMPIPSLPDQYYTSYGKP